MDRPRAFRLIAATLDPMNAQGREHLVSGHHPARWRRDPAQVYELYRLRDWIEHYYKPAKHELGWADYQVRPRTGHCAPLAASDVGLYLQPSGRCCADQRVRCSHAATVAGEKIRTTSGKPHRRVRGAGRLERHPAAGPQLALPLGSAAGVLATLIEQRPTARTGRAPRPSRPLASP